MNNFRFTKIIPGVSPTLAKETVLSKIINMVDVFRITLSKGFDDNNKKYIDTIMKLDNSKTILIETKGIDLRVKNTSSLPMKKWDQWTFEYSEYAQESDTKIYVDYPQLGEIEVGTLIYAQQSWVVFKVLKAYEDIVETEVIEAKGNELIHFDRIWFDGLDSEAHELSERDKKDILWGLEYGAHVLALACANSAEHIQNTREFLESSNARNMKIFAKIETSQGLKNLEEITKAADGIVLVPDEGADLADEKKLLDTLHRVKKLGKPVLIAYAKTTYGAGYSELVEKQLGALCNEGVDGVMMETFVVEDEVFPAIEQLWDLLSKYEENFSSKPVERFEEEGDFEVRDYIIYNSYRSTEELNIRAIICFTENGYTASRLSSLVPKVPIITFTQSTDTYRYLSLVWGVKGYKISQSFNYENLKRIWKEMIRIIFKWNISLDDKILILQANETIGGDKSDMINGTEIYNFKNI